MPHLVCLDKAGQYLLSLGTISHNPEKLFVMDFSGLRLWRHKNLSLRNWWMMLVDTLLVFPCQLCGFCLSTNCVFSLLVCSDLKGKHEKNEVLTKFTVISQL